MTITEVSEKYKIPLALLQRYATEKADAESKGRKLRQAEAYRFHTGLRTAILNS